MKEPKKGLALIISNMKNDKSGQNPYPMHSKLKSLIETKSDYENDDEEGFKAAMQDFMNAIHGHDVLGAMEAFKDVMATCPECSDHADDEDYITADDSHGAEGLMDDDS